MWSEPTRCFASLRMCGTSGGAVGLWYGLSCRSWTRSGEYGKPTRPTQPINRNRVDTAEYKPKPVKGHDELPESPVEMSEECR
jgi:hypothetical protein